MTGHRPSRGARRPATTLALLLGLLTTVLATLLAGTASAGNASDDRRGSAGALELVPGARPVTAPLVPAPVLPTAADLTPVTDLVAPRLDASRTQPGLIAYGGAQAASPYASRGALVVAGRTNFADPEIKRVADAGGTVLVYLDAIIDNPYGRYHQLLVQPSVCGPAVPRWPGSPRANGYGYLNDFRPGSVLQAKLECVLTVMVVENPHMAGFFADDLGSRSHFPGFSWAGFGATNQALYRAGAIQLMHTFRRVADAHGLVVMVNGTWQGGSLESAGGGYPDMAQHGNALADGTLAEHHQPDAYWGRAYPCASQWADLSLTTRGTAFNFAVTDTDAQRAAFARTGCYGFAATQPVYDRAAVWTSFSRTGLPSGRRLLR